MMELITYWMYGVVAFSVLFALRAAPGEDARFLFRAVLVWPFSITVVAVVLLLDAVGWNMEAARTSKMFGFRKPTNTQVRGFAFTVFFREVQFWKSRKA
jgi:hypothetical protein